MDFKIVTVYFQKDFEASYPFIREPPTRIPLAALLRSSLYGLAQLYREIGSEVPKPENQRKGGGPIIGLSRYW